MKPGKSMCDFSPVTFSCLDSDMKELLQGWGSAMEEERQAEVWSGLIRKQLWWATGSRLGKENGVMRKLMSIHQGGWVLEILLSVKKYGTGCTWTSDLEEKVWYLEGRLLKERFYWGGSFLVVLRCDYVRESLRNGGRCHWKRWLKAQEVRVLNDSTTWC